MRQADAASRRRAEQPKKYLLNKAKSRAKAKGLPFSITEDDFEIPVMCPVFDIPIETGKGKTADGSPTIDRIVGHLGYVPGNVRCISHLANRRKTDMSIEQIERLLLYSRGEL